MQIFLFNTLVIKELWHSKLIWTAYKLLGTLIYNSISCFIKSSLFRFQTFGNVCLLLQVVSKSKCNQIGTLGSVQLQLLVFLYLRPSGPTFPPDWFPLSVPGSEAVWDGSHLQHRHLQWDVSTFLWPHLPVCSQSLCLCLNDCRWVSGWLTSLFTLNALGYGDILGCKYNNCPSLMTHRWPVVGRQPPLIS